MEVHAVQQSRRFSNFNQPRSIVLDRLIQKGLLRPLTNSKPPNPTLPSFDPNHYCRFHQVAGHSTDTCIRLKHEIQNLIDAGKIIDPENPNTKTNPFPNYRNVPPPATMTINSGVSKEEVLNSFEDINFYTKEETLDALKSAEKFEDLLGQHSGKFDYKVFYSKPPSYDIPIKSIIPGGWGDEFDDDELASEEDKKAENTKQPQKEEKEEIMPSDSVEPLCKKETCTVEV